MTKHIHMMGVGGSGMAGIAFLASKIGYKVTGCDLKGYLYCRDSWQINHYCDGWETSY
ncbi:MAG: Mur ligase domain-containing protein [Candidatus Woesebacteria bacterium]|nr:Mur ligase domain-containing protein [Candidatus Woesebacteria bacterium]